jgi:nitrite reductase (NADH) small subunit
MTTTDFESDTDTDADADADRWTFICRYDDLPSDRGVAALVEGEQVAVFRLGDGSLHAVSNRCPGSGANVISRGIVGSRGTASTVASPMYKDVFDLRTGVCLTDPTLALPVYLIFRHRGLVFCAPRDTDQDFERN